PATGLPLPASCRRRREDQPDRDRNGSHRHALREPALHGGGCWRRRHHFRRTSPARNQPCLPEQVIEGWRYFGYAPEEGKTDADMARRHAEVFLDVIRGEGFAQPNPRPMFPNPPGLLRLEPYSEGLRDRIWWGAATTPTAEWTG